nr:uncharacterized protein LOC109171257 isoform X1 [Ipomoea trifida]
MEKQSRGRGIEENTMAILDTSGFNRDSHHRNDDRLAFLEAVRSASLVPDDGIAPTKTMLGAIFQILKDESTLELVVASYQLLKELDKRFPRVYLPEIEKSESSSPTELVVVEEAWSPFSFGLDSEKEESNKDSGRSIKPLGFHYLVQDLGEVVKEGKPKGTEIKTLRNMLLLQYLVNVLERDTLPRIHSYKENMNWNLIRESLLNMLLGSRKIIYKSLIKDCLSSMCYMYHEMSQTENLSMELSANCNTAVVMALPEVKSCACVSLKKLLLLIIELDSARNSADLQGLTNRADGVRTPVSEIILDEITYNSDILSSFFQIFDEPKQKLKLIVQYLQKYIPKSSVRTRRSNGSANDATFESILKCFSNANSTKSIIKKISGDVAQLLLGHAFQAYLSMCDTDSEEGVKRCYLPEVCQNIITAFTCIKREDKQTELSVFSKETLFTAATILSLKS